MTQSVPAAGGASKPIYRAGLAAAGPAGALTARNQALGQFVKQGQVIMLADNTGVSFMNHVHVHVMAQFNGPAAPGSGGAAQWSIPFVYQDVGHSVANGFYKALAYGSGTARMFTSYSSGNTRVSPE
jgi:murein DD-endopeptidase MepM/ murein hydrolase activator NlpD